VLDEIPKVCGITVNTAHGYEPSIEKVLNKFHPNTESMEGAAFMFVCENEKIPYAQIRAVSNYMERRNKTAWDITLAFENLNIKVLEILNAFD
jgi:futalosine hydrolase